jgi:hypothetical protein
MAVIKTKRVSCTAHVYDVIVKARLTRTGVTGVTTIKMPAGTIRLKIQLGSIILSKISSHPVNRMFESHNALNIKLAEDSGPSTQSKVCHFTKKVTAWASAHA